MSDITFELTMEQSISDRAGHFVYYMQTARLIGEALI